MFMLTACGSDYDDASVDIPTTWAAYTIDTLSFRFEAGYQSSSWDATQTDMDSQIAVLGASNQLALFGRFISPASAKGTTNYIDFGYWDTGHTVETAELNGIYGRNRRPKLRPPGGFGSSRQPRLFDQLR